VDIKAFRGLRFDSEVVGDVGDCITPPYDVIDAEMQQKLYEKSTFNVVRIIKGKTTPADTPKDNQYTRAGQLLNDWIRTGALKPDTQDCIYSYFQDFQIGQSRLCRSSFIALGKLEEFGSKVRPHEKTLDGPRADRLRLMRAKAAQFGQIFMLYDDPEKIAEVVIADSAAGPALVDCTGTDGIRHRLFAIDKTDDIDVIIKMMSSREAVIADGHHRYETALNYYKETGNPAALYRMMTFVNMHNEGLVVLATHRLVANLAEFDIDKFIRQIEGIFQITRYPFADKDDKARAKEKMFNHLRRDFESGKNALGIYAGTNVFYAVLLKEPAAMDEVGGQLSRAAKKLDVNILHKLILEKVLGIGEKQLAGQHNIEYIKDIGDAIDKSIAKVDTGEGQVVFFLNPPKVEQVKAVAEAGERMPQKSTFFYPKIYTGLVINKL